MPTVPDAPRVPRPLRILYADDVRELREVVQLVLGREGHRVECMEGATHAWVRLSAHPTEFDLIITDHHMPVMSGLEFVVRLRQLPFHGKIMVFSSELCPDVMAQYEALHVDGILYKPVLPAVLRRTVADLFSAAPAQKHVASATSVAEHAVTGRH